MALTLSRTFSAETTIANFCDHVITAVVRAVEEISSKEVGVAKQVAEIAKKETEIAKKETEIANKVAVIANKETEIRDKKAEIRDRDDIIKSQSAELNYTRHQAAAQGHRACVEAFFGSILGVLVRVATFQKSSEMQKGSELARGFLSPSSPSAAELKMFHAAEKTKRLIKNVVEDKVSKTELNTALVRSEEFRTAVWEYFELPTDVDFPTFPHDFLFGHLSDRVHALPNLIFISPTHVLTKFLMSINKTATFVEYDADAAEKYEVALKIKQEKERRVAATGAIAGGVIVDGPSSPPSPSAPSV